MSQGQYEDRLKNWKYKATTRSQEISYLKKRIKELIVSRDNWKRKYMASNKSTEIDLSSGRKAKSHHYSLLLVSLLVDLYRYGSMSLRSCRHTLISLSFYLGVEGRIPSHTSIRNWLCKCGSYRLDTSFSQSEEYVVYLDESISFGSEKILLMLGVPSSAIPEDRRLSHHDMEVLYVGVSHEWKGEQIAQELANIGTNKTISYVVSDQGSNLRKAYKSLNYSHVEDCTHLLANHLKKLYGQDETFMGFSKLIGKLRQKWNLSKDHSQYMPPSMRGKLRFANIFPCVSWAKKMIDQMGGLPLEVAEQLSFLVTHKSFIEELVAVQSIFKTVCTDLKNNGFNSISQQAILNKLTLIETQTCGELSPKALAFKAHCENYLAHLEAKSRELNQSFLLCSSDIIESYFGKFKTKINPNSRSGLTEFIFTIATFGKRFSVQETKKALENVKCKDLKLKKITKQAA